MEHAQISSQFPPLLGRNISEVPPHQCVGVVAGEDEDVDGGGVVGDADAVLGHVLGVVVRYHSR